MTKELKKEIQKFVDAINAAKIRISLPWQEPKFITAKVKDDE